MTGNGKSYRPALDGTRAVAVLAVIGYHFGFTWVPGGFLGVDIFFVLSGYLITSLLLGEYDATHRIALADFWARRVRRLLPALLLLLLAVSVWVYWFAPVETWMARRRDLLWTLFYGANWHFIDTSQDYFAKYAGASPLLHTWSLAIEAQFYFLWPLVFFAMVRILRCRRWLMEAICVDAALASTIRMATLYDSAGISRSYYGTDSRAQELLVGVALALLSTRTSSQVRRRSLHIVLGVTLAAVVASFLLLLHDRTPFYYRGGSLVFALVVAGLIWIVESSPSGTLARALSLPPLPWIGRISYGLYLWHWFVIIVSADLSPVMRLSLTFGAAALSYYIVERPVREGRTPWVRRSVVRLAVVTPIVVALTAVVVTRATTPAATLRVTAEATPISSATPTSEAPPDLDQHLDVPLEEALADHSDLECPKTADDITFDWCVRHQGSSDRPVLATIGDSMARALRPGLEAEAAKRDFSYIQAAWGGCTISGTVLAQIDPAAVTDYDLKCRDEAVSTVESMIETARPDVLILSEHGAAISQLRIDDQWIPVLSDEHDQTLVAGYVAVFERFLEHVDKIVLVETNQDGLPVGCIQQGAAGECPQSKPNVEAIERFNGVLHSVAEGFPGRVSVISVEDLVCPGGTCLPIRDGMLVRYDGQHYTATFSRWLGSQLVDRIDEASGVRFYRFTDRVDFRSRLRKIRGSCSYRCRR